MSRGLRAAGVAALVALSACSSIQEGSNSEVAAAQRAVAPQPSSKDTLAPGTRVAWASLDSLKLPRISRLVLMVADPESVGGRTLHWIRVEARDGTKRVFGYEILVESVDFLRDASIDPTIVRYVLYPAKGAPLEYVHVRDGSAFLPAAAPRDWLPRPVAADLERVSFLGRVLERVDNEASTDAWPRGDARRLALDPDFQIADSRHFRDDGTGHAGADWRWVELSAQDYRTMLAAGFDLFELRSEDLAKVEGLPAFVVVAGGWQFVPDLVLRGNYLGAVMYSDEPAVHACRGRASAGARSPAEVAQVIVTDTRSTHTGDEKYGRGFLAKQIDAAGFGYGDVVQPPYPAWEAIASAAWYELEAGAGGWCLESRLQPATFARNVERAVGVAFPSDAASCIRFHIALARGAARHFHVPWGMSVFGQMDPAAADLLFPLAYDAGATYFWMWTSDGDHHVPYARQLELAKALRTYATAHPRSDVTALTRSAEVALVLPWGYAVDEFTFSDAEPSVWGIPSLALTAVGDAGVTHGQVLAAAMREAAALLKTNTTFDILFLRDSESAPDYREVRRVGADASIQVERP